MQSKKSFISKHFRIGRQIFIGGLICLVGFTQFACSSYDEQDVTIIAYLRINDLLENKLEKTSMVEIAQFQKNYEGHNSAILLSNLTGMNVRVPLDYDADVIKAFNKKYTAADGKSIELEKLEADIVSELWNYLNWTYSDVIPSKAQNAVEGRYYTIAELKEKYPDYKEVELEDFSPMELVSTVTNEKLFDWSMLSEGDVNLRTLYVYYLANKPAELANQSAKTIGKQETSNNAVQFDINFESIIKTHFPEGIPNAVNVNEVKAMFQKLSSGENPMYENNTQGFEKFADDYFETDMFSGEDVEE